MCFFVQRCQWSGQSVLKTSQATTVNTLISNIAGLYRILVKNKDIVSVFKCSLSRLHLRATKYKCHTLHQQVWEKKIKISRAVTEARLIIPAFIACFLHFLPLYLVCPLFACNSYFDAKSSAASPLWPSESLSAPSSSSSPTILKEGN